MRRSQRRKPFAEILRQVLTHDADLFLDQVVVIQQPFSGGHDARFFSGIEDVAVLCNHRLIVIEAFEQVIGQLIRG
ncbi:hypothetical protein D3C71_813760 [compost metagenome]